MNKQPLPDWENLKKEILSHWQEIFESDLGKVKNNRQSFLEFLQQKFQMKLDEANRYFDEISERFHLFEQPHENPSLTDKEKKEKVLELNPKRPSSKDLKPRDDLDHR